LSTDLLNLLHVRQSADHLPVEPPLAHRLQLDIGVATGADPLVPIL
jgi:hypothetical protein